MDRDAPSPDTDMKETYSNPTATESQSSHPPANAETTTNKETSSESDASPDSKKDIDFPLTKEETRRRFINHTKKRIKTLLKNAGSPNDSGGWQLPLYLNAAQYSGLLGVLHDLASTLSLDDPEIVKENIAENKDKWEWEFDMDYHRRIGVLIHVWNWGIEELNKRGSGGGGDVGIERTVVSAELNGGDTQSGPQPAASLIPKTQTQTQPEQLQLGQDDIFKSWYNNKCLLTGTCNTSKQDIQCAPILHARMIREYQREKQGKTKRYLSATDMSVLTRCYLPRFWKDSKGKDQDIITVPSDEWSGVQDVEHPRNLIPLKADVREAWDRHLFALRPIRHHTDPQHRLYLQVIWIKDIAEGGLLLRADHNCHAEQELNILNPCTGTTVDFSREDGLGNKTAIKHGDIYEIITTDPINNPLPNIKLLQIRYAIQKVMGGMCSTQFLKEIFDYLPPHCPPVYDSEDSDDEIMPIPDNTIGVPNTWEMLIQAAEYQGIISAEQSEEWRETILNAGYQDYWDSRTSPDEPGPYEWKLEERKRRKVKREEIIRNMKRKREDDDDEGRERSVLRE